MNPLDYTFASTNLRVVHARNETLLNILLKQNPNSTQIKPLEDCLRRLNTCSVYFYETKNKLAETLRNQNDIFKIRGEDRNRKAFLDARCYRSYGHRFPEHPKPRRLQLLSGAEDNPESTERKEA